MKKSSVLLASFIAGILFSVSALIITDANAVLIPKTNLELYIENEIILVGKIVSPIEFPDKGLTEYQIKVERYLKSPSNVDLITAIGEGAKSSAFHISTEKIFNEGDRVLLFLNLFEEEYMISPYSINAEAFNADSDFMLPPLRLHKAGISTDDIVCRGNLILVLKSTNAKPACVKLDSIERLVSFGWIGEEYLKLIK